jgi:transposase-like protein/IS1 family transposase
MKTSPRRRRRCPFTDCPSHKRRRSAVVRHGRYRSRRGDRLRLLCRACKRTFGVRRGTVYYRLRSTREAFDLAMRLQVEGLPQAAAARSVGISVSTIARWRDRAASHARAFEREYLQVRDPIELQLDELCARGKGSPEETWIYCGLEVWSRVWAAKHVGRRTKRSTRLFLASARKTCGYGPEPVLVTTDPYVYYEPELRRAFGPRCVYVQVENLYRRDRVLRTESRLVFGHPHRYAAARARLEDGQRPNTSYIERLNLFVRRSTSYLQRRTPAPARVMRTLSDALDVLRCYYNFIKPHSSLRFGTVTRTPAMQAGIFNRALTFRDIFNWMPPPEKKPYGIDFTVKPAREYGEA